MTDRRAFIAVDVQPGFCEGGSLAVEGGHDVAGRIAGHLAARGGEYAAVVASRDYHVDPGAHFGNPPDFVDSWPRHCVAGTAEAELHPSLAAVHLDAVFDKGAYAAAYSAFEAADAAGVLLGDWLRRRDIDSVDVAGLATDYCVAATARDALAQGFAVRVLLDLSAGVDAATTAAAVDDLRERGAELVAAVDGSGRGPQ
ncbi:MAG TPA: isochorismatase family protein [Acidimicrobiales bacterium]|nr:isochorismatase family protein [Acidimicrobiales bacterium]